MGSGTFSSLIGNFFSKRAATVTLFVTNRCNARCRMCFNWQNMDESKERNELTLDEIKRIAKNFGQLHSLILSGGEPFLRKDLCDIVTAFHENAGTHHISIPTNLFTENAPEIIREIAQKHPDAFFRILISIDGVGEDHDRIRGRKGGFDLLMKNYYRLLDYKRELNNLSLNAVVVLSSFNAHKITEVLDFAGSLHLDDVKLIYVRGDTRESEAKEVDAEIYRKGILHAERLTQDKDRTRSFYNNLFSSVSLVAKEDIAESLLTQKLPGPCNAGTRFLVIDETGVVFPCEILGKRLGSLRESNYDIKEILRSTEARAVLKYIRQRRCFCTMDCNAISNVVFGPFNYPRVLKKLKGFYP